MIRILSMTATFGRLEHAELKLEPGLNLIHAPNEWGKSTWCAFLMAMFYGINTRSRAAKGVLPDKERFRPWSGSPMEGSVSLLWDGRAVTIQRRPAGRVPMGDFRAFETDSGLPVPELTGENCGLMLLGVEAAVYRRSGFLRLEDLPVTRDEALDRRLNALVTTGDDSPAMQALEGQLKDLRNRCRYHKSGLLPQVESELDSVRQQKARQEQLRRQEAEAGDRLEALILRRDALLRHQETLQRQEREPRRQAAREAGQMLQEARLRLDALQRECSALPGREAAMRSMEAMRLLNRDRKTLELEESLLPREPEMPRVPPAFAGLTPQEAMEQAGEDAAVCGGQEGRRRIWPLWAAAALLLACAAGVLLAMPGRWLPAAALGAAGVLLAGTGFVLGLCARRRAAQNNRLRQEMLRRYEADSPEQFPELARGYAGAYVAYETASAEFRACRRAVEEQRERLNQRAAALGSEESLRRTLETWDAWGDACRSVIRARRRCGELEEETPEEADGAPDSLTLSPEETRRELAGAEEALQSCRDLQARLRGQLEAGEDPELLADREEALEERRQALEDCDVALHYAQAALDRAKRELQSRFAPGIAARAGVLMRRLTGGRYDRVLLEEDLSLSAGAAGEDTVRPAQWRSAGTVDQLWFALRLAVSERLLSAGAPLILDDALLRFDDVRLQAALELLRELARERQIVLFTCQDREARMTRESGQT